MAEVDMDTGAVTYKPTFEWEPGVHPAADLFPMLDPEAFTKLVGDIDRNGQRDPIWLDTDGQLIDGRNRLAACQRLGREPLTRTYSGDSPTELVLSLNVHRRQLTPAQLAAVAVDALPMLEAEAETRRLANLKQNDASPKASTDAFGKSSAQAAEAVGVGQASVERLKRVRKVSEETFEQVRNGEKSIREAEREVVPRFKSEAMNKLEKAKAKNPPDNSRAAVAARVAKAKEMAAQGYTSRQIAPAIGVEFKNFAEFKQRHGVVVPADKVTGNTLRLDSNRIVTESVSTLEGLVMGIGLADVSELDPEQIDGWVDSFTDSIKALTKFRNQMKEHTRD
jgi:ParB-like chromosome segregation protein Spo0J